MNYPLVYLACPHCNNGWIEHAPDPKRPAYRQVVRCTCVSPGNRLGIAAIRQQAERQAETREWVRVWEADGKPGIGEIMRGVVTRTKLKDMSESERDEFARDFERRDKEAKARRLRGAAATQDLHERGVLT